MTRPWRILGLFFLVATLLTGCTTSSAVQDAPVRPATQLGGSDGAAPAAPDGTGAAPAGHAETAPHPPTDATGVPASSTAPTTTTPGTHQSSATPAPGSTHAAAPKPEPPTELWRRDVRPVTQAVDIDGVAVLYVEENGRLLLQGTDRKTGDTLWRRAAAPGAAPTGIQLWVTPLGRDRVIYFAPATIRPAEATPSHSLTWVHLAVAEARTGTVVARSEHIYRPSSRPDACGDDVCLDASGRMTCAEGEPCANEWDTTHSVRWAPGTDETTAEPVPAGVSHDQGVGEDLVVRFRGDVEALTRITDGEIRWVKSLTGLFGVGYTTRYGWSWVPYGDRVYVGSVGHGSWLEQDPDIAGHSRQVGIDRETGRRVWLAEGVLLGRCDEGLPHELDGEALLIRCRVGSGTTVLGDRGDRVFGPDPQVWLERVDPFTGEVRWQVELAIGEGDSFSDALDRVVFGSEGHLVVIGRSAVDVDLRTGEVRQAGPTTPIFCASEDPVSLAATADDSHPVVRPQQWVQACTVTGQPSPLRAPWPSWAGTTIGDVRVVAGPHSLAGYAPPR